MVTGTATAVFRAATVHSLIRPVAQLPVEQAAAADGHAAAAAAVRANAGNTMVTLGSR